MFIELWMERLGAGTSTVCSELLCQEMCVKIHLDRSEAGGQAQDDAYSLHAQASLTISQMKMGAALIASPGTDRKGLSGVSFQGRFSG